MIIVMIMNVIRLIVIIIIKSNLPDFRDTTTIITMYPTIMTSMSNKQHRCCGKIFKLRKYRHKQIYVCNFLANLDQAVMPTFSN